jgi:hypothetical protein
MTISVDNRFDPPATNWRKKTSGGRIIEYPSQWHATIRPTEKYQTLRLLAVIRIGPNDAEPTAPPIVDADGAVTVGNWQIAAELNVARPASLLVRSTDGKSALAADVKDMKMIKGLHQFPLELPPAVLVEQDAGIAVYCEQDWEAE